jgi:CBS domain-containing protein
MIVSIGLSLALRYFYQYLIGGSTFQLPGASPTPLQFGPISLSYIDLISMGVSIVVILGHFVVPLFLLMSRNVKRDLPKFKIGLWLFLPFHFIEWYWLVMPNLMPAEHTFHWVDFTALMAVGDALALLVSHMRDFSCDDFALYHPAGSLGRKLTRVEEVMRSGKQLRRAQAEETVRQVFVRLAGPRRRSGAVLVEDVDNHLLGIFTDSDLARLFERQRDSDLDRPIGEVMTVNPKRVRVGSMLSDAVELMNTHKISELPVVDRSNHLVGLIDVTDLIGLVPADFEE